MIKNKHIKNNTGKVGSFKLVTKTDVLNDKRKVRAISKCSFS